MSKTSQAVQKPRKVRTAGGPQEAMGNRMARYCIMAGLFGLGK